MKAIRLNSSSSVRRLLARTITELLKNDNDKIEIDRARVVGYLSSILLKAIDSEILEARISEIEKQIKETTKK